MSKSFEVSISAAGQPLAGTFFPAANGDHDKPVLICPATGITQKFYFPFARWLAGQGSSVLVFDYRGIGKSLQESHVKHCEVKKQDWGLYDMPAALDFLLELTGQESAYLIGHSAGGQLFGLMHNRAKVRGVLASWAKWGTSTFSGNDATAFGRKFLLNSLPFINTAFYTRVLFARVGAS